ncbi:MAG: CDP-diacylglycerol O-phosphatidyltransferase [Acidimicrobiia bacterium]|nr:CDP-diacylglycerol O-phosphatidyltransferase [Acidimicrobiia bacterium]
MIPWLVHLYTASSALFGFLALTRIFYDRYQDAFFWMAAAIVVDATDGVLARRARVAARLPHVDGARLDDLVDYVTYVLVPAFFVWHALLVPDRWSTAAAAAMLLSSAYGFSRDDAKTADHFYTGFPSYWNIVVFYLYVAGWPRAVNLAILLGLAVLVFVPIRYVYPSRTPVWRTLTIVLGLVWGALMLALLWQMPAVSRLLLWASFAFPAYYVALSIALHRRRASA